MAAIAGGPKMADVDRLRVDSYWNRLALHRVPQQYLLVAAFVSYLILAIGYLQGLPAWLAFGAALTPWGVIVLVEIQWVYEHFHWFALFALMAFVQLIHYSEHTIEVIQVHLFGVPTYKALAIFSALNVEGVHFSGDTFLTIGTLLLLTKFPRNPWLWVAAPFQIWHQAEHTFLFFNYVFMGTPAGGPGLLASPGGAIGGGVGLSRPDLHWIYNTLYTIPFSAALVYQLKRTYDDSLDIAFPEVAKEELLQASRHLETFHFEPAQTVLAPGDEANRLYIVVDGEAAVLKHDEAGNETEVDSLRRGQYFGEVGLLVPGAQHNATIRARTKLTVLAMEEGTFEHLMDVSKMTHDHMLEVAETRTHHLAKAEVAAALEQTT